MAPCYWFKSMKNKNKSQLSLLFLFALFNSYYIFSCVFSSHQSQHALVPSSAPVYNAIHPPPSPSAGGCPLHAVLPRHTHHTPASLSLLLVSAFFGPCASRFFQPPPPSPRHPSLAILNHPSCRFLLASQRLCKLYDTRRTRDELAVFLITPCLVLLDTTSHRPYMPPTAPLAMTTLH